MITQVAAGDLKILVFRYGKVWPVEVILHPDNYTN